jgi:hypothetical protein
MLYDEFGRFMCDIGNIITKRRTHPSGLMCLSARAPLFVLCVLFYLIYPRRAFAESASVMMGDRARKAASERVKCISEEGPRKAYCGAITA